VRLCTLCVHVRGVLCRKLYMRSRKSKKNNCSRFPFRKGPNNYFLSVFSDEYAWLTARLSSMAAMYMHVSSSSNQSLPYPITILQGHMGEGGDVEIIARFDRGSFVLIAHDRHCDFFHTGDDVCGEENKDDSDGEACRDSDEND
jgi:hypothetical protein